MDNNERAGLIAAVVALRAAPHFKGDIWNGYLYALDNVLQLLAEPTEAETTNEQRGLCCMKRHANAISPWTCDCPCHGMDVSE